MGQISFHTKEILLKIVFYGPGLCGKTTTLKYIHSTIPAHKRPTTCPLWRPTCPLWKTTCPPWAGPLYTRKAQERTPATPMPQPRQAREGGRGFRF